MVKTEISYECIKDENGAALRVETDLPDGMDISYIALRIRADKIKNQQWEFSFYSEVDQESHGFGILSGMNENGSPGEIITYLIPTGSSPFWQFSGIDGFRLDGIEEIESIEFYQ